MKKNLAVVKEILFWGDLFEAFLGALLLDAGLKAVEAFLNQVVIPKVENNNYERVTDYKTALQELLQVDGDVLIDYEVLKRIRTRPCKML